MSAIERLVEKSLVLADNAEAYLDLEERGEKNYPTSLRLCVLDVRNAIAALADPPLPNPDPED